MKVNLNSILSCFAIYVCSTDWDGSLHDMMTEQDELTLGSRSTKKLQRSSAEMPFYSIAFFANNYKTEGDSPRPL